uniref:Nup96 domain-containing protein n=1 Tax=Steinernema glaseri TaxID=37863 RepID=A0A1I8ANR5_9BILA
MRESEEFGWRRRLFTVGRSDGCKISPLQNPMTSVECEGSSRGVDMFDMLSVAEERSECSSFCGVRPELRWSCVPTGNSEEMLLDEFVRKRPNGATQKLPRRLKFYGKVYATTENGRLTSNGVKDLLDACNMWIASLESQKAEPEVCRMILEDSVRLLIHVEVAARQVAYSEPAEYGLISTALVEAAKRVQSIQTVTMVNGSGEFRDNFRLHAVVFLWLKTYAVMNIVKEVRSQQEGAQLTKEGVVPILGSVIMCGLIRISQLYGRTNVIPCECVKQAWMTVFLDSGAHFWQYFTLSLGQDWKKRFESESLSEDEEYLQMELEKMVNANVPVIVFFDVALFLISDFIAESNVESDFVTAHEAVVSILQSSEVPLSRCFYQIVQLFSNPPYAVGGAAYFPLLKASIEAAVKKTNLLAADIPDFSQDHPIHILAVAVQDFYKNEIITPSSLGEMSFTWEFQVNIKLLLQICTDPDVWRVHHNDLWTFFKDLMESAKSGEQLNLVFLVILCILAEIDGSVSVISLLMTYLGRRTIRLAQKFIEYLESLFKKAEIKRLLNTCCLVAHFLNSSEPLKVLPKYAYKLLSPSIMNLLPEHFEFFLERQFTGFSQQCCEIWARHPQRLCGAMARYTGFCVASMGNDGQKRGLELIKDGLRKSTDWVRLEYVLEFMRHFFAKKPDGSQPSFNPAEVSTLWVAVAMVEIKSEDIKRVSLNYCNKLFDWFVDPEVIPFPPDNSSSQKDVFKWYMEAIVSAQSCEENLNFTDWFNSELVHTWVDSFSAASESCDVEQQQWLFECFCCFLEAVGSQLFIEGGKWLLNQFLTTVRQRLPVLNLIFRNDERIDFLVRASRALLRLPFSEDLYVKAVAGFVEAMGESSRIKEVLHCCEDSSQGRLVLEQIRKSGRVAYHMKIRK